MQGLDTKLMNGTLATSERLIEADIGIAEGKIVSIGRPGSLPASCFSEERCEHSGAKIRTAGGFRG